MAQYLNAFSGRQFIDANGNPYVGAKLFIYAAGSSTKVTTTKDSAGAANHLNPIILNARGEPADGAGASQAIWQTGGSATKLVLAPSNDTDPPVSAISTWDNLFGINDTTSTIDQWESGPTPTYVSATQFTLVGDQTNNFHVGRRIKATVTAGTVYGVITVSAYTTLTTITVVLDSGALDSGLSAISYGRLTSTNTSIPGVKLIGDNWMFQGTVDHQDTVTMIGKAIFLAEGADVATASSTNIWVGDGNTKHLTGTATINDFGTAPQAGAIMRCITNSTPTLVHGANLNLCNSAQNIVCKAEDSFWVYAETTTVHKVFGYQREDGTSLRATSSDRQTFTSSNTWTKPAGFPSASRIIIECWGGGGGGAKVSATNAAGGGGGGGYSRRELLLFEVGSTEVVTIGPGGASTGIDGNSNIGGNTTFGGHVTAYGGGGGGAGNATEACGGYGGGEIAIGSPANPGGGTSTGGEIGGGSSSSTNNGNPLTIWGGGAGQGVFSSTFTTAGKGVFGGGGGAAQNGAGTGGTAGTSLRGGAGGAAKVAGSQPGGGGGGSSGVGASGAGAAGQCVVTVVS